MTTCLHMLLLAALLASSAALRHIGGIDALGDVNDVQTIGNIAYVAGGATGLMIFDVSDASSPKLLGSSADCIGCTTAARYVTVVGTTAYVVPIYAYSVPGNVHTALFAIVDVSTPSSPRQLGTYERGGIAYHPRVFISGKYVYSRQNDGIHVVDVSTPSSPSLVTKLDSEDKWDTYCVAGTTLFAFFLSDAVLQLYDVTNPNLPETLGDLTVQGKIYSVPKLSVFGSHLYVASDSYAFIIDISSPLSPKQMGTLTLTSRFLSISVSGNTAYVGADNNGGSGLVVVDISDPSTPVQVGSSTFTSVLTLSVSGTKVVAAGAGRSLVVFDVSNPSSPQPVGGYSTRDYMVGVELFGSVAVVTTIPIFLSNLTMQTYDVRDVSSPQKLGSLLVNDGQVFTNILALSGTTAYFPFRDADFGTNNVGGFHTVSLSDPSKPAVLGAYEAHGTSYESIAVDGTTVYATGYLDGMDIIDVSIPSSPSLLGTFQYNGAQLYGVTVNNGFAYSIIGGSNTILCIVDVHDPQSPTLFTTLEDLPCERMVNMGDTIYDNSIAMHGTTVYYSCSGSFGIIDIENSSSPSPQLLGEYTAVVFDFAVDGNTVYLASYAQLLVLDVSTPSSPRLVGSHFIPIAVYDDFYASYYLGIAIVDERVYVASYGLYVFEIPKPTSAPPTALPTSAPSTAPPTSTPTSAPPTPAPPTPAPPTPAPPTPAPPTPAPPTPAPPTPAPPTSAPPTSAPPTSAPPTPAPLTSAPPTSAPPTALPTSAPPTAPPTSAPPTAPISRIGGIDALGDVNDVQTIGNIAYVAGGATGLMIFDVSDASSPKLLGSSTDCIGCTTAARYVTVVGTTAYVVPFRAHNSAPVHTVFAIVDVSTPSSPRQLGTYEKKENPFYSPVFISENNYVYSDQNDGIHVVDVSTPSSPSLVTKLDSENNWDTYCVAGTTLFAFVAPNVLQLYEVTTPYLPQTLGKLTLLGSTASSTTFTLSVFGSHLYVAFDEFKISFVTIINFSSRLSPKQMGTLTLTSSFSSLTVSGNTAYVGTDNDGGPGLVVVDISDPSIPVPVGSSTFTTVYSLSVSGTKVVAGVLRSLVVFDVSDPSSPQPVGGYSTRDYMVGVELFGSVAVVTATPEYLSNLTMQTYDVRDASSPQELGSLLVNDYRVPAEFLALSGTTAYLPFLNEDFGGFQTVSVSDPSNPTVLGAYKVNPMFAYRSIALHGTTVYATRPDGGMDIIDASVPSSPSLLGTFQYNDTYLHGVTVNNGFAYSITTGGSNTTLCIVDVHHPQSPTLFTTLEDLPCEGRATSIAMHGTTVYYSCSGRFGIIDIKDASWPSPQLLGEYTAQVFDFAVDGNTVYLASYAQLLVLDVSTPSSPRLVDSHFIPAVVYDVGIAVSGGRVYVASHGLYVFGRFTPTAHTSAPSTSTPPTTTSTSAPSTSTPPTTTSTSAPSTTPPTSGPSTPVPDGTPPSENSNDTWKIVAIVMGVALSLVIVIGVACYCKAKKTKVPVSMDQALVDFKNTNDDENDYSVAA